MCCLWIISATLLIATLFSLKYNTFSLLSHRQQHFYRSHATLFTLYATLIHYYHNLYQHFYVSHATLFVFQLYICNTFLYILQHSLLFLKYKGNTFPSLGNNCIVTFVHCFSSVSTPSALQISFKYRNKNISMIMSNLS